MAKSQKRTGKVLIGATFAVIAFLALTFIFLGWRRTSAKTANEAPAAPPATPVKVVIATPASLTESARVPVTLNPLREASLSFKLGGRVKQVLARLGSVVPAGGVLARLDDADLENSIRQAQAGLAVAEANLANLKAGSRPETVAISQAQLQQAEANLEVQRSSYERQKSLYDEGLIARQQFETVAAAYQAAQTQVKVAKESLSLTQAGPSAEMIRVTEAQVQQARLAKEIAESQRDNLRVVAPFSGSVTMARINQGEMAAPGVPVFNLADLSKVYAIGYVGQELAVRLRAGDRVEVKIQAGGQEIALAGRIETVSQAADPVLRTYQVKILCERGGNPLMGGMMGEAVVAVQQSGAEYPVLPREALLEESGRTYVYVVENGQAKRKEVEIGVDGGDRVEIVSGLAPGEQVVLSGQHLLQDGAQVEVQ